MATAQLISILSGTERFFHSVDSFFIPGYLIGFALGLSGGTSWVIIGQVLTFFAVWGIGYVWLPAMRGLYRKLVK